MTRLRAIYPATLAWSQTVQVRLENYSYVMR
jgi:hypothetical protein